MGRERVGLILLANIFGGIYPMQDRNDEYSIEEILLEEIENYINRIIDIRTEAYKEWNGEKTIPQKRQAAISWMKKMNVRDNTRIYAAKFDDSIVGYIWGYEKEENEFCISHIGVLPEQQRMGIGRALIHKCESLCIDHGYERLSTSTYNRFQGMLIRHAYNAY